MVIHLGVWQKPTPHWKAIILQSKINLQKKFFKELKDNCNSQKY